MDWKPEWSPRIRLLYEAVGLRVEFRKKGEFDYSSGTNPGEQAYLGGGWVVVDPSHTEEFDLLHEFAHHLEALVDRPASVGRVNWGLGEDDEGEVQRLVSDAYPSSWGEREKAESLACDLQVGLLILWGWPWHQVAGDLNLVDWWPADATYEAEGPRLAYLTLTYWESAFPGGSPVELQP